MKNFKLRHLVLAAAWTIIVCTVLFKATTAFNIAHSNYRTEAVCIQGWVDMGVERKYIHRNDGDCFYSKTKQSW